jgi:hypothetical protein
MLAVRIVSAHHAAMECFRRAAQPDIDDNAALRLRGKAVSLANMATRTLCELQRCQAAAPAYPMAEKPEPRHAAAGAPAQPAGDVTQAAGAPSLAPPSDPRPAATASALAVPRASSEALPSPAVKSTIGPHRPYAPESAARAA